MAALRDIARDFAAEIRDGIGWTIVYRTGRSWNALTIWSDIWKRRVGDRRPQRRHRDPEGRPGRRHRQRLLLRPLR